MGKMRMRCRHEQRNEVTPWWKIEREPERKAVTIIIINIKQFKILLSFYDSRVTSHIIFQMLTGCDNTSSHGGQVKSFLLFLQNFFEISV